MVEHCRSVAVILWGGKYKFISIWSWEEMLMLTWFSPGIMQCVICFHLHFH